MQRVMRAFWRQSLLEVLVGAVVAAAACATYVTAVTAASLQTDPVPREEFLGTPSDSLSAETKEMVAAANEAPLDTAQAVVDSAQILAPWLPTPVDTVLTAVVAEASTLPAALNAHASLEAVGTPIFSRIRTDGMRYWYELVVGPFPTATALDSALAELAVLGDSAGLPISRDFQDTGSPQNTSAEPGEFDLKLPELHYPVADLWERQSRSIVAPPQHLAGRILPPAPSNADSSQGG